MTLLAALLVAYLALSAVATVALWAAYVVGGRDDRRAGR